MGGRNVRAGQTINLRARFKDDLGDPAQAGSVYVHIFEPGEDPDDLTNAMVVSGIPTYLGQGIFQYAFDVPVCGPAGEWVDQWQGALTCQNIDADLAFVVVASGLVTEVPCQLFKNDVVEITIGSGIMDLYGNTFLEEDVELQFLTLTDPSYTNLRKVRLEIGGYLGTLPDATIQTAILEGSLEADVLNFTTTLTNSKLFQHARREYATCMAANILLSNVAHGALRSKTLGDFSVSYDTTAIKNAMNRVRDCLDKWAPQLMAGGGAKAAKSPSYVVKGECDPDRPTVSRMWRTMEDEPTGRRIPAANDRVRATGERRSKRSYKNKKWW